MKSKRFICFVCIGLILIINANSVYAAASNINNTYNKTNLINLDHVEAAESTETSEGAEGASVITYGILDMLLYLGFTVTKECAESIADCFIVWCEKNNINYKAFFDMDKIIITRASINIFQLFLTQEYGYGTSNFKLDCEKYGSSFQEDIAKNNSWYLTNNYCNFKDSVEAFQDSSGVKSCKCFNNIINVTVKGHQYGNLYVDLPESMVAIYGNRTTGELIMVLANGETLNMKDWLTFENSEGKSRLFMSDFVNLPNNISNADLIENAYLPYSWIEKIDINVPSSKYAFQIYSFTWFGLNYRVYDSYDNYVANKPCVTPSAYANFVKLSESLVNSLVQPTDDKPIEIDVAAQAAIGTDKIIDSLSAASADDLTSDQIRDIINDAIGNANIVISNAVDNVDYSSNLIDILTALSGIGQSTSLIHDVLLAIQDISAFTDTFSLKGVIDSVVDIGADVIALPGELVDSIKAELTIDSTAISLSFKDTQTRFKGHFKIIDQIENINNSFKSSFKESTNEPPTFYIQTPKAFKPFINDEKIMIMDLKQHSEKFNWCKMIIRIFVWFYFFFRVLKLIKVKLVVD